MEFSANQIAQVVSGIVVGDENITVSTFAKIEEGKIGAISFLGNPKYAHYIYETESSIILVNKDFEPEHPVKATLIKVDNAYESLAKLMQMVEQMKPKKQGIHPTAIIDDSASIGKEVYIGPYAVIGSNTTIGNKTIINAHVTIGDRVKVGDDCTFFPNVTIYDDCELGNEVVLNAGTVIGADGFGFAPSESGYEKIPQIGTVIIEDKVEIGANSCVDRSTMGATIIKKGVKLDNFVQVAHNVEIGEHTVISAQVGISGSTKIGKWCMVGGQTGFAGHSTIGDKTYIGAQSGIPGNLKGNQQVIGTPAMDPKIYFRCWGVFKMLPDMRRDLIQLKKDMISLQNK
ncbi:MAG: UDP-3-O-(3-hydroxymyristoyl)glucosamine N-acyltransferase [Bacteroidaceae bacterium]